MSAPENILAADWDVVHQSIVDPSDANLSVDHQMSQIPGISSFSREDIDYVRRTTGQMRWLGTVVAEASKSVSSSSSRSTLLAMQKDARMLLVNEELSEELWPFKTLEPRSSARTIGATLSLGGSDTCMVAWGPGPGPTRNLLSPQGMSLMCWLGTKYAQPLLDFVYAFAKDDRAFKMSFLSCPAQNDMLDMIGVSKRAATLRASPAVNSPGAAIVHLAKIADTHLQEIVYAVFHACESRSFCLDSIKLKIPSVNVSEMVKSEAIQFRDCSSSVVTQVQSTLPDLSSLPDVEPNFIDDRSASWFRSAEYTFKSVKFPAFSGLRSDQLSELRWHKYQSDALHARKHCTHLSERQVIQHLMSSFDRTEQHFTVAQHAAMRPHCTVRQWLETIRDFYFTNGQFRHNIEQAWQSYNVDESADFNELIHHVTEYYRLIFIDYPHMPGRQSRIDFACILFTKLQQLMQPQSTSAVSSTLTMFLPLSQLLVKFNDELKPAMNESTEKADTVATAFIEWSVSQLLQVRESANTVKRFNCVASENRFDYARLKSNRRHTPPAGKRLQAAAAALQPPDRNSSVQPPRQPKGPSASSDKPGHIPFLKEMCHTDSLDKFKTRFNEYRQLPGIRRSPDLITAIEKELAGGSTAVHVALSRATRPLPPSVKATPLSVCQAMMRMTHLHPKKQCPLCPNGKGLNQTHPMHPISECPTFNELVPTANREAFFQDAFNQTRQMVPLALPSSSGTRQQDNVKRDRYDPNRKGSDKSKRPRHDTQQHIR